MNKIWKQFTIVKGAAIYSALENFHLTTGEMYLISNSYKVL